MTIATKVPLLMIGGDIDSESVVNVKSRAYAISDLHPDTAPDAIATAGYYTEGDLGGALYKKVASEPSHAGKFSITLSGIGSVVWYALATAMPCPEMFGAKGDEPGNGTGTDDLAAFQSCINFSRRIFLQPNRTYRLHGELTLPRFQQIIGLGVRSATEFWVETGQTGATRLLFTGSGQACFKNQDPANMLSHGGMRGFVMRATGAYTYMMYFRDLLDFHLTDIGMQTDSLTMHGIVSQKIAFANPSWVNSLVNVGVRLPDASTGRQLDIDWSDSNVERCHFTGGVGVLERGYGTRFLNNQIERSSFAGLTIQKTGNLAAKNTVVVGNSFDANAGHGILFDNTGDTSGTTKFHTVVANNNFRTQHPSTGVAGGGTIGLTNTVGGTYTVGPIVGNVELASGVSQFGQIGLWSVPQNVGNMQA